MPKIQFKRGLEANLPQLAEGEPGFTTDSEKLFIGSTDGNVEVARKDHVDDVQTDLQGQLDSHTNDISQTNTRIDNLKLVDANAEMQAARGTFPLLGDRMNDISSSLADKAKQTDLNATNNTVALKADKSYVDSAIQSLASGAPKGVYATLSALQTAFPTGSTGIYLVTADGKWYYWNGSAWTAGGTYQSTGLSNGSVTPEKTTFINVDALVLYDYTKAVNGYLNSSTGALNNGGTSYTSDFIPISLDKDYATNVFGTPVPYVYMYDTNKAYIGYFQLSSSAFKIASATYPACVYIKLTFPSSSYTTGMLVEGTTLPASYTPYAHYKLAITDPNMITAYHNMFVSNPLDPTITTFMDVNANPNLLDGSKTISGYLSQGTGANINSSSSAKTSDFIPVQEGHIYSHDCTWSVAFYDANKNYLSGYDTPQNTPIITIPVGSGIAFVRISGDANKTLHFVEGSSIANDELRVKTTKYAEDLLRQLVSIPYFNTIANRSLRQDPLNKPRWEGKKANFLGDSITAGYGLNPTTDNYTKTVNSLLGFRVLNNYGYSGSFISKTTGGSNTFIDRYAAMDSTADLVVVFGGVNDYRGSVPLGTIADTTDISFYGALQVLMNGIITKNPKATVVFITPMQDNSSPYNINYRNSAGFYLKDYVKAVKDVAELFAVPVLDMYRESGINALTASTWTQEGLHPTKDGAVKIGTQIAGFLKRI